MDLAQIVRAALPVSLGLLVVSLGMRCPFGTAMSLLREPGLMFRSFVARSVVMPLLAALLATVTHLNPAVKVALIAISVAPVPPLLPSKQLKLVSRESYVYGLLIITSLFSIILVPAIIAVIGALFGREASIDPRVVARVVSLSVFVPLAVGMFIRRLMPAAATRLAPLASSVGSILLYASVLVILVASWRAIGSLLGDGTLLAFLIFVATGLLVGHVLGGPNPDDRTVLALASASRHPGVAIAVGTTLFTGERLVAVAVVLYLLVSAVASIPYTTWRKRLHEQRTRSAVANDTASSG